MKDLVRDIAARFADFPDDISVAQIEGRHTVIIELRCNAKDIGRLIGRNGKTISSIRALLHALGAKDKKRVIMEAVGRD